MDMVIYIKQLKKRQVLRMKRIILYLLAIMVLSMAIMPAFADDTVSIPVSFPEPQDRIIRGWEFPYTDEWFLQPAREFNRELAKGSLGMTVSAFEDKNFEDADHQIYLKSAGFEDIRIVGYDIPTDTDTFACIFGRKKIGDFTLIAIVGRGSGYGKEWGGNLRLGKGIRHEGFSNAAAVLDQQLNEYLQEYPADGPVKIWYSGYSRSAAAGNIAAADWIASGKYDDVYAYLFATPRTTKEPEKYSGIYNICGTLDIVPQIPMQCFGYERYGTDLFLPSTETISDFSRMKEAADAIMMKLIGKKMFVNTNINLMLRLTVAFVACIFDTAENYVDTFQEKVFEMVGKSGEKADAFSLLPGIVNAVVQIKLPEGRKDLKEALTALGGYIMLRIAGLGNSSEIENGSWDPDEGVFVNLVREHLASTYISWLFSDLPDEDVLRRAEKERILFLDKCDKVKVSKDDLVLWTMEGKKTAKGSDDAPGVMYYSSGMTIITLPEDGDFVIRAKASDTVLKAIEIQLTPAETICSTITLYKGTDAADGNYEFAAHEDEKLQAADGFGNVVLTEIPCEIEDLIMLDVVGFGNEIVKNLFKDAFPEF